MFIRNTIGDNRRKRCPQHTHTHTHTLTHTRLIDAVSPAQIGVIFVTHRPSVRPGRELCSALLCSSAAPGLFFPPRPPMGQAASRRRLLLRPRNFHHIQTPRSRRDRASTTNAEHRRRSQRNGALDDRGRWWGSSPGGIPVSPFITGTSVCLKREKGRNREREHATFAKYTTTTTTTTSFT
jgi:hypothetical protein